MLPALRRRGIMPLAAARRRRKIQQSRILFLGGSLSKPYFAVFSVKGYSIAVCLSITFSQ